MKRNRRRLGMFVMAVTVMILLVTFATGQAAKTITLTFWHHEAPAHRVAAMQKVIQMFEKAHPNIKLNQQVVMWGDAWPKTIASIQAGNTPDFQMSLPELTLVGNRMGAALPVDDLIKELDKKYKFIKSQLAPYYYEKHHWGVPIWTMPMTILTYRPSYLEKYAGTSEPPKTWDELLAMAKKLTVDTDNDGKIDIYGIGLTAGNNLCTQEQVYTFMAAAGATMFDAKGNLTFNSAQTKKAIQFYADLFKFAPPGATGWLWGELELNFGAGSVAMMPYFGTLQKRFYDMKSFDYAAVPMPYPAGGKSAGLIYPNDITIYKAAQKRGHLKAVKDFVRFVSRPDINAILTAGAEPGGFVPVTEAATKDKAYWNNPIIAKFKELNETIISTIPNGKLYGFEHGSLANFGVGDISGANIIAEAAQKVVTGSATVDQAVEWATAEIKKLMK
ncbi:MAG: ABC transporter substrate-binding protein [Patescibacteria group bacterium]